VGGTCWEAAKYLFVINLTRANLPAVYGPLAFAVSLVLWAYVSSLVLVFGALMSPRAEPSRRSNRHKHARRPAPRPRW
jgi:membrane protein/epoxyqueuosine reductase